MTRTCWQALVLGLGLLLVGGGAMATPAAEAMGNVLSILDGPLPKLLALVSLCIGLAMGIVEQSFSKVVFGLSLSIALGIGPQILLKMDHANALAEPPAQHLKMDAPTSNGQGEGESPFSVLIVPFGGIVLGILFAIGKFVLEHYDEGKERSAVREKLWREAYFVVDALDVRLLAHTGEPGDESARASLAKERTFAMNILERVMKNQPVPEGESLGLSKLAVRLEARPLFAG